MTKKVLAAILLFAAAFAFAAEPTASHRAAAEEFLIARGTPEILERQCLLMADKQIAAAPELAEHRDKLLDFYRGAFGFAALKNDLVDIYAREFTEDELREMIRFCNTPVGKKLAAVNAKLVPELAELLERKVLEKAASMK